MRLFFEGMLCGFLNGFFGSGGGVAAVPVLEHEIKKADPNMPSAEAVRRAHAGSVAVIFVLSIAAAISYFFSGGIDYKTAFSYIPYGLAGAIAGSIFLRKIKAVWLQKIFGGLVCAAAIRSLIS